jgi:hypothetical protein
MEFNYMKEYLISDLLCLYKTTKSKMYLDEVKRRLSFCSFTGKEIKEIIRFENEIIDSKKEKYSKKIIDKYWFLGKKSKEYFFKNIDEYMYNHDSNNSKVLLLSELLTILDEAILLKYSNQLDNYKAKLEILKLSKENEKNWVFFEFKNRIEYSCRCANHIVDGPKQSLYNEKINYLYDNELQIILFRWPSEFYNPSYTFIPYSNQYFDRKE